MEFLIKGGVTLHSWNTRRAPVLNLCKQGLVMGKEKCIIIAEDAVICYSKLIEWNFPQAL